jgi:hypothetical protein
MNAPMELDLNMTNSEASQFKDLVPLQIIFISVA